MRSTIRLPDDIDRRIDRVAAQTNLTRSQIVEEALPFGRSLAWQEQWVAGVQAGIKDADRGDFATDEEIAAVLTGYDRRALCSLSSRQRRSRNSSTITASR